MGTGVEDGSHRSSERHAHLLLAQMNKMRLQSELCDVRLLVGGRAFRVHRVVLAASGPYFSALFNSAMSEAREEEVHIAGVEADVFESLLEFIYTGRHTSRYTDRCSGQHTGRQRSKSLNWVDTQKWKSNRQGNTCCMEHR